MDPRRYSHPVMESVYHEYYEEVPYRPSIITAQRLAGGMLGANRTRFLQARKEDWYCRAAPYRDYLFGFASASDGRNCFSSKTWARISKQVNQLLLTHLSGATGF
jgi:hypothetical protein